MTINTLLFMRHYLLHQPLVNDTRTQYPVIAPLRIWLALCFATLITAKCIDAITIINGLLPPDDLASERLNL